MYAQYRPPTDASPELVADPIDARAHVIKEILVAQTLGRDIRIERLERHQCINRPHILCRVHHFAELHGIRICDWELSSLDDDHIFVDCPEGVRS